MICSEASESDHGDEKNRDYEFRREFTVIGTVRHELSHSKAMMIWNREEPYKVDEEVTFTAFSIGHFYEAHIVCFPGGVTGGSSGATNNNTNNGACYIGVILRAISDPNGATKKGWRSVRMSLDSLDRGGSDSPCAGSWRDGTTDHTVKPWDRDSKNCRMENVLDKVTYLWIGHKNNFGEIFNRNHNFITIEIRDCSHSQSHRNSMKQDLKSIYDQDLQQSTTAMRHQQNLSLYEHSNKYGDITLSIVPDEGDTECSGISSEPPRKRMKWTVVDSDGLERESKTDSVPNQLKVSGIILRSASSVFAAMLDHKMKEKEENLIRVHGATAKDVDDMIYYIVVHDLRENVNPFALLKLAHCYQLNALFTACSNRILVELTVHNFVESVNVFTKYEIEEGYERLVEFGKIHLEEIRRHESFQNLSFAFKHGVLLC